MLGSLRTSRFASLSSQEIAMPLSMYSARVIAFVRTLSALSEILDKAAAHCAAKKIDPSVLLTARL
jgi:hypothetical protein